MVKVIFYKSPTIYYNIFSNPPPSKIYIDHREVKTHENTNPFEDDSVYGYEYGYELVGIKIGRWYTYVRNYKSNDNCHQVTQENFYLMFINTYKNGILHGQSCEFNQHGIIQENSLYTDGKCISRCILEGDIYKYGLYKGSSTVNGHCWFYPYPNGIHLNRIPFEMVSDGKLERLWKHLNVFLDICGHYFKILGSSGLLAFVAVFIFMLLVFLVLGYFLFMSFGFMLVVCIVLGFVIGYGVHKSCKWLDNYSKKLKKK